MSRFYPRASIVAGLLLAVLFLGACATGPSGAEMERLDEYRRVINSAEQAMNVGQFNRVVTMLVPEISLLLDRGDYPDFSRSLILMEWMLSSAHAEMGQWEAAILAVDSAIGHHRDSEDESPQLLLELLFEKGKLHGQSGQYPASIDAFTEAVELMEADGGEAAYYLELADAYGYIAVSQRFMRQYDASVSNRERAIEILENNGGDENAWVLGRNFQLLADVLYDQQRYRDAVTATEAAIRYHEMHGTDPSNLADSYYFNAINIMSSQDVIAARASFLRALEIYRQLEAPNPMYAAISAYNLGWGFELGGQPSSSPEFYRLAAFYYENVENMLLQRAAQNPAAAKDPMIPEIRRRIADAYDGIARTENANPEDPETLSVSRRLVEGAVFSPTIRPFMAVSAWNSLISALDLVGEYDIDLQETALRAVFIDIPAEENGLYRRLSINGFFRDGTPLEIRATVMEIEGEGQDGAVRFVMIQSNAVLQGPNRTIDRSRGRFISLDDNLSFVYVLFDDGVLAPIDGLEVPDLVDRISSDQTEAGLVVNIADYLLKDNKPANDATVVKPLTEIWENDKEEAPLRTVAGLNLFLYHLAASQIEEASALLSEIENAAEENLDESFFSVIWGEAPAMLELMRALSN
jgi:tetratricopeptide (TPR) repeat protein